MREVGWGFNKGAEGVTVGNEEKEVTRMRVAASESCGAAEVVPGENPKE